VGRPRTPHAVRRILQHALWLRDARDTGTVDQATLSTAADQLEAAVDRLIGGATRYPPNRRLLAHLAKEREYLFTFLRVPGVNATNWRAEQAIRPAAVTRKSWGGNRTRAGADTWQALPACCAPLPSRPATPSSCWPACCKRPGRSWPTSPSPDAKQHTRYLNTYHLLVDRRGLPLAVGLSAANTHDSMLLEPMVDAVPAVKGPCGRPGRPRRRPAKPHGDNGYDDPRCRSALRRRGIIPRIARRGIESSERLGRHR
jgi:Transposase IS66 family